MPKKDPVAAKHYYETAANLGDVDAMNEVGWCYETGFGTPKDKAQAARYYRLAERNGNKTLGNSWYVLVPPPVFLGGLPYILRQRKRKNQRLIDAPGGKCCVM